MNNLRRGIHEINIVGSADASGVWTQRVRGTIYIDNLTSDLEAKVQQLYAVADASVYELLKADTQAEVTFDRKEFEKP